MCVVATTAPQNVPPALNAYVYEVNTPTRRGRGAAGPWTEAGPGLCRFERRMPTYPQVKRIAGRK